VSVVAEPRRTGWIDATVVAALCAWALAAFLGARDDFSYDYANYIAYLEQLRNYSRDELLTQLEAFFPYPYVLIPPAGFWEGGFAMTAWALMGAGLTPALTYAVLGTASIAVRTWLLRALGLGWFATLLVTLYAVTLFEANAIRLGCALTLCVAALCAMRRGRIGWASMLFVLAASMHLQSLGFSIPLLIGYAVLSRTSDGAVRRAAVYAIAAGLAVATAFVPDQLDIGKLAEYADSESGSIGINLVSMAGLLAVLVGTLGAVRSEPSRDHRLVGATLIAAMPALALLLLATQMGALGDRIWQFAFVGLVAGGGMTQAAWRWRGAYRAALLLCLLVAVLNIIVRYPLSNFFAPLVPHTPITPIILIT
jgi:hypothetical protein